jgi:hypothetical protein
MKYKYLILFFLILGTSAMAQGFLNTVTWEVGIPVSKTSEFNNSTSYLGFGISQRKFLDKFNSVGLVLGWNNFDERVQDPININLDRVSGTISGTQLRAINIFPILLGLNHYFGVPSGTQTVIGLNTGVYFIAQRMDIGVYRFQSDNWHFGIAPELSFLIPMPDFDANFFITGKYNYAFDSGTSVGGKENNFYSFWNINIGFAVTSNFW